MITTTSILKKRFSDYSNPIDKIKREVDNGNLIRITRGIYETKKNVNPSFLASSIISPSYLSFEYALSYYGLIPEKVFSITSATLSLRKNKTFTNFYGRFDFSDVPSTVFSEGITYIENNDYIVKIATMEKAICDSLYKWRVVHSVKELKELLFVDKRIDENIFMSCDFKYLNYLASLYNKTNHHFLMALIRKEYDYE